jgi:hypothetical protein
MTAVWTRTFAEICKFLVDALEGHDQNVSLPAVSLGKLLAGMLILLCLSGRGRKMPDFLPSLSLSPSLVSRHLNQSRASLEGQEVRAASMYAM